MSKLKELKLSTNMMTSEEISSYVINNFVQATSNEDLATILGGIDASALYYDSIALGEYAESLSDATISFGAKSKAIGSRSSAYGYRAIAEGKQSIAIGNATNVGSGGDYPGKPGWSPVYAKGDYSIAMGRQAHANGYGSMAIGDGSIAGGNGSLAIGGFGGGNGKKTDFDYNISHSEGERSIAIGHNTNSKNVNSVAIGTSAVVSADNAIQLGMGLNDKANTLKFKNTTIVDENGKIPTVVDFKKLWKMTVPDELWKTIADEYGDVFSFVVQIDEKNLTHSFRARGNMQIRWGDDNSDSIQSAEVQTLCSHTYRVPGQYVICINGINSFISGATDDLADVYKG